MAEEQDTKDVKKKATLIKAKKPVAPIEPVGDIPSTPKKKKVVVGETRKVLTKIIS